MKKIILVTIFIFMISGCSNVKNLSFNDILQNFNTYGHKTNIYRSGYKYYLPRSMQVEDSTLFNEIIVSEYSKYYLYVDALSYKEKIVKSYNENKDSFYSKTLNINNKYGYVEINKQENEKYLIEIMYNYAKIEVMVDRDKINEALLTSISILKSVEYNDEIIANLFLNDILDFTEEEFNIFNTTSSDSTYLQMKEEIDEDSEYLPDTDLLN